MTTTNKDFVVKHGLRVGTGVTFPDNSVQTTAADGTAEFLKLFASNPGSAVNGQIYYNTAENRPLAYYNGSWHTIAYIEDTPGAGNIDGGDPTGIFLQTLEIIVLEIQVIVHIYIATLYLQQVLKYLLLVYLLLLNNAHGLGEQRCYLGNQLSDNPLQFGREIPLKLCDPIAHHYELPNRPCSYGKLLE